MFRDTKDAQTNHCPLCEENGVEIAKLQAQIAMLFAYCRDNTYHKPDCRIYADNDPIICTCGRDKALSATTEQVAAWKAEQLKPLQREVAMLRDALRHIHHNAKASGCEMGLALDVAKDALADTQATAEEYEREVRAKALKDLLSEYAFFHSTEGNWLRAAIEEDIAELRAKNGDRCA